MFEDIIEKEITILPFQGEKYYEKCITFYTDKGTIAKFLINDNGELIIEAEAPFEEAGKKTAKIFWEAFAGTLQKYYKDWKIESDKKT